MESGPRTPPPSGRRPGSSGSGRGTTFERAGLLVATDPPERHNASRRIFKAAAAPSPPRAVEPDAGDQSRGWKRGGGLDYKQAGVDQERKDRAVEEALGAAPKTFRAGVIPNPGGFAGLFALGRFSDPVLVACTDGV